MELIRQTNQKAITALTLGILSLLIPIIGFILGVIGIFLARKSIIEIDNTNQKGRGMAISGLICSIIGIIIQLFVIFAIIGYYSYGSDVIAT
ncbi:DUF4190 domain-containing protein [Bacillus chungangensis]|uniref:Tic20 family protein n=1 Tax=Bacillus chungangensis TaxID=587633 RepID=A0ABT9WY32_9BACI|nr:DUF4190 domain-containing protein [Bacillus chungangensis]MDQ0178193.1 putative Tic20 family protein [Bacillus chungangensis]